MPIRGMCPFSLTLNKSALAGPDGSVSKETSATRCIGLDCQLWQYPEGLKTRKEITDLGECSHVIAAQATSGLLHLFGMMRMADDAREAQAGKPA
jgi:hypothetical protein